VIQGEDITSCDTGRRYHKLWYREKISQVVIQGENITSCDTGRKYHKLWYREKISQVVIQGENITSCDTGRNIIGLPNNHISIFLSGSFYIKFISKIQSQYIQVILMEANLCTALKCKRRSSSDLQCKLSFFRSREWGVKHYFTAQTRIRINSACAQKHARYFTVIMTSLHNNITQETSKDTTNTIKDLTGLKVI